MNTEDVNLIAVALESLEIEGVKKEAILRASCSKHYYHLFHLVCEYFIENFNDTYAVCGGGTHQAIRSCCELLADQLSDKEFKKLAYKLKVLHDIRVSADYRIKETFSNGNLLIMKAEKNRALTLINLLIKKHCVNSAKQA